MGSISIRYCYTEEKIDDMSFLEETFKVFGSSLEDIEIRDKQPIPTFLITMTDYLREHGLKEEGLFRVSGGKTAVQELKERINTGNTLSVNFSNYPIPVISTLYKNFFDSLPEPLIPYSFSHFFLECKNNIEDITTLINMLPRRNRIVLGYLIKFLKEVAENEDHNKMSVKNLCITFGPILFRLTETSVEETINLSQKGRSCLETMIINYHDLFVINNSHQFSVPNLSGPTTKEYVPHRRGSHFVTLSSTSPTGVNFPLLSPHNNNNNSLNLKEVASSPLSNSLRTSKSKSNNLAFTTILKSPQSIPTSNPAPPKLSRSLSDNDLQSTPSPLYPMVVEIPQVDNPIYHSQPLPHPANSTLASFFKDLNFKEPPKSDPSSPRKDIKDKDRDKDSKDKDKDKEKEKDESSHKRRKSIDFSYHNIITRKVKDIKL